MGNVVAVTKEAVCNALAARGINPEELGDLMYEMHVADAKDRGLDLDDDDTAVQLEATAAAVTNEGLAAQVEYLINAVGSPEYAALALNDFMLLPVLH